MNDEHIPLSPTQALSALLFRYYKLKILLSWLERAAFLSLSKPSPFALKVVKNRGKEKEERKGGKKREVRMENNLEWDKGLSGDGELAWGSRALRACVFVFLFGHCSSKAELCPSHGNDAAGHNRLQ